VSEHLHVHPEDEFEPRRLERAATWLSVACAVHCLVVPLAVTLLPALGASQSLHMSAAAEHILTLLVVLSVSAGAAWGFRRHRDLRIAGFMLLGLIVYLVGHALDGSPYAQSLSVLGALSLAAASFASARLTQTTCEQDHAH
jgi:uncharacterized membrane protein YhaH (DUF805 family)